MIGAVAAGARRRTAAPVARFPIVDSAGQPASYWVHWNSTATPDPTIATEAARRKYVLLNAWEGDYVAKIKAANPNCMCLVYKDLSSTRDYAVTGDVDAADLPTGVGYADADTNHPGWFLTDSSGARLAYEGYAGHWQMDVAASGYAQKWADNVVANATAHGFDGVLGDNALWTADQHHPGTVSPSYSTDSAIQAAYRTFLATIRPQLNAAGLLLVANLSNARLVSGGWNSYMQYLDGGWDEFWLAFSSTDVLPAGSQGWATQVAELADNETAGKITLVQPHFTVGDTNVLRYTLASFLCGAGGRAAFVEANGVDDYGDPTAWHTEYSFDLGTPTGPYSTVQTGVFRRDFSAGCVVVNANTTGSSAVNVSLGGTYLNEAGSSVTSVSLAGTRGAILRATSISGAYPASYPASY